MEKHICPNCKTEFEGRSNQKFCSQKCKDQFNNRAKTHGTPNFVSLGNDHDVPVGANQSTKVYVDRNWYNQLTEDRNYWREKYQEEVNKNADFCATHMKAVWGIISTARNLIDACKFGDTSNVQWTLTLLKNKVNFTENAITKCLSELEATQLYQDSDNSDNLQQLSEYPYEVDDEDDTEDWSSDDDNSENWDDGEDSDNW
ncbi:MAG: hypothetical protein MJZ66_04125 [Bacteroidales bacterium]|nr:hypothetical protein [Bacteroidales bacterium]